MASKSSERYQVNNLFDWTGGIRDKRENPLAFPQDALMSGENVDLVDGGLKTRRGISLHSSLVETSPGLEPVFKLTFDNEPYGSTNFVDATGRHSVTCSHPHGQLYICSGFSYLGTGSVEAHEANGEYTYFLTIPQHDDWFLGSGGTQFKVYTYFQREDFYTSGSFPLAQQAGWNIHCQLESGGSVVVSANIGGTGLSGTFAPQPDQWWRIQIDNEGGTTNLRAQPASQWTSGTVLDWDPQSADAVSSGDLILFETNRIQDHIYLDEFTVERSDGSSGEVSAEIVQLRQVRFPTNESSYLIAQVRYPPSENNLFASFTPLPTESGMAQWTHLYGLASGAGVVSLASLNDRLVMTEGLVSRPLVFPGCLDQSGADWAVPKAVLLTYNDGFTWHDISSDVCDRDPETCADVGSLGVGSGWIAVCTDLPKIDGFYFEMESGNSGGGSVTVEGYSGSWDSGYVWSDKTSGLTTTGTIDYLMTCYTASYLVLNGVPGYWFRIKPSGTAAGTSVRRILFKAPTQELTVIGEGQPDTPLGFLYHDNSDESTKDFTVQVSDNSIHSFARLNDGALENPTGIEPGDPLLVGYLAPFNAVELTPHNDYQNKEAATLMGYYWDGTWWSSLSGLTDGTEEPSGTTLGQKGRISWIVPENWKECRPYGERYPHAYWIMFLVSDSLSDKTYITEARVWPVPETLKKHKTALTVRDRLVLCNRTDAPDQIDISRALEEYGFVGKDSSSIRIGGQDAIVAAAEAFNQGFIAKTEDWYLLNGYNPATFSVERAEAAGQTPINNQVVVRAPHTEADMKNLMGLYYLNQTGAWYFAGLKVYQISEEVSWWDPNAQGPRLDLDHLHKACGVYWPERNWVIWSVPMIVDTTEQPTNNRLIVYDLTHRAWLPPFTISLASLTTAYHHRDHAPGKLGPMGLYGGDHVGRVVRLFGPGSLTDLGTPISAWVETGWLHFKAPEFRKLLRIMTVYGRTDGSDITVKVFTDGDEDSCRTFAFDELSDLGTKLFAQAQKPQNVGGRFFKFRIEFSDATDVFGLQVGVSVIREWGEL